MNRIDPDARLLLRVGHIEVLWFPKGSSVRWMWSIDWKLRMIALGPLGIEWGW